MVPLICIILIGLSLYYIALSFTELYSPNTAVCPRSTASFCCRSVLAMQDSLENYFGRQRIRGSCCDNPNVDQYFNNVNTLRVVQELNLDIPGSNVRGRKRAPQQNIGIDVPLPRRSSTSKYTRQHTDKQ